jgi:hypothetical protein
VPRFTTEDGLWNAFEVDLVRRLGTMQPGRFLIISSPERPDAYYVQFAVQPDWTLQGEVSGQQSGRPLFTGSEHDALLRIGWDAPDARGGWPNYRVFWQSGLGYGGALGEADVRDAAAMVKQVLRGVFRLHNPRDIHFEHGSFE